MKEFKPKTRKQLYMAAVAGKLNPQKDLPKTKKELVSDYEITEWKTVHTGDEYTANIEFSFAGQISSKSISVTFNGNPLPKSPDHSETQIDGFQYNWTLKFGSGVGNYILQINKDRHNDPSGELPNPIISMSTIAPDAPEPKTNVEKYYAARAVLPDSEDPIYTGPIPEPKTVDEYYTALLLKFTPEDWENSSKPTVTVIGPANPGINDG